MKQCVSCGKQLNNDDSFCSGCGKPVGSNMQYPPPLPQEKWEGVVPPRCDSAVTTRPLSREKWEGSVSKCPRCGESINAFAVRCPSCGYEFRNSTATASLRELSLRLQEITARSNKATKQTLLERLRRDPADTDDQAASLIRAFPIPNTKEDLLEFIIASASNINADAFSEWKKGELSSTEVAMSNAWLSKLEQAYEKASIALADDPSFSRIQEVYNKKMKKVSSARRATIRFIIGFALVWVVLIAICLIMSFVNPEVR